MLSVQKVSFSYEKHHILTDLSLSLEAAQIGTLIGSSGSGKSTLFKLLTGLCQPKDGAILINGDPMHQDHVACMMQEDLLLPWRNVISNVTLCAELGKNKPDLKFLREKALELLVDLGLQDYIFHFPDQLSGGMRQRVSLARALIQNKPLLLLDEPFGALDVILREQMYDLLRSIRKKYATTILMVTHDFRDALSLSDKIFLLSGGQIRREWDALGEANVMNEMRDELRKYSKHH